MLQMSPSSTNIQPWNFVIADDDAGKARIAKSTQGAFHFNTPKVLDASHVVVLCTRIHADDEYLQAVLEKEDQDGRYAQPEFKAQMHQGRQLFLDMHRFDTKDEHIGLPNRYISTWAGYYWAVRFWVLTPSLWKVLIYRRLIRSSTYVAKDILLWQWYRLATAVMKTLMPKYLNRA